MTCAKRIVQHLLEADDDFDVKSLAEPLSAAEHYELQREIAQSQRKDEEIRLQSVRARILAGDFTGVTEKDVSDNPSLLPSAYYRAKSRLWGLIKRTSGAAHVASVEIISGAQLPKVIAGSRGGFFTKGGAPISHPSAYSKVGWSNMKYLTNNESVTVGIDWCFEQLPKETQIFARWLELDPGRKISVSAAKGWKTAQGLKYDWAYNTDDPPLAEGASAVVLEILGNSAPVLSRTSL